MNILTQIFDTDGIVIASSKGTRDLTAISKKSFLTVLQGKERFDAIDFDEPHNRLTFRVFTTPVFENEKVAYIVQVASPLTSIQAALKDIKVTLSLLFPITVLVMTLMGAFLVKATLKPVDSIITTIRQITAENMRMRLDVPETKDEIRKLAETFNDMLERLETAFASQKRLFEDLSHEIKTPLTILKGELEVTLKKIRSREEYESTLKSSLEEINKMAKLVENILTLARLDLKKVMPERRQIDLDLLARGVMNSLKGLAELKQINMRFEAGGGIEITGDEEGLKTLLINIVDNAIKYSSHGSGIEVKSEKVGHLAIITVRDSGIGIPPEDIRNIFDRFYRVDKARPNGEGFGLGLSIAKSIVESHDGSISAESEPGKGTTFRISLPLSGRA